MGAIVRTSFSKANGISDTQASHGGREKAGLKVFSTPHGVGEKKQKTIQASRRQVVRPSAALQLYSQPFGFAVKPAVRGRGTDSDFLGLESRRGSALCPTDSRLGTQ